MLAKAFGWTVQTILATTPRQAAALQKQLVAIEAIEDLRASNVARMPHLKPMDQRDAIQSLERRARGESDKPKLITSKDELRRFLRGEL